METEFCNSQQGTITNCSEFPLLGEHSLQTTTTTNCTTPSPCNKGLEQTQMDGLNIQNLPRRSPIHHLKSIPKVMETQPQQQQQQFSSSSMGNIFKRIFRNERKNLLRSIAPRPHQFSSNSSSPIGPILEIPPVAVGGIDRFLKSSILSGAGLNSAGLMDWGIRRRVGFFGQSSLMDLMEEEKLCYHRWFKNRDIGSIATVGVVAPLYESLVMKKAQLEQHLVQTAAHVASGAGPSESAEQQPSFEILFGSFEASTLLEKLPAEPTVTTKEEPTLTEEELDAFFYIFVLQDGTGLRHLKGLEILQCFAHGVSPHGLWAKEIRPLQKAFDESLIPDDLVDYWPNVLANGKEDTDAHIRFWKDQWEGHGRFGLMKQEEYMRFIIKLQKHFAPIINEYVGYCTTTRETRKYVNVTQFITRLKVELGIFVTVDSCNTKFSFRKQETPLQFLGEIKIYLDGRDPFKTIMPSKLKMFPKYDIHSEVSIIQKEQEKVV